MTQARTLGLAEAAVYTGLSDATINRHRKAGKLKHKKEESGFRFKEKDLDRLMQSVTPRKKSRKRSKRKSKRRAKKQGRRQAAKADGRTNGAGTSWFLENRRFITQEMTNEFLIWAEQRATDQLELGDRLPLNNDVALHIAWDAWQAGLKCGKYAPSAPLVR